jgi:hypothetical protein
MFHLLRSTQTEDGKGVIELYDSMMVRYISMRSFKADEMFQKARSIYKSTESEVMQHIERQNKEKDILKHISDS